MSEQSRIFILIRCITFVYFWLFLASLQDQTLANQERCWDINKGILQYFVQGQHVLVDRSTSPVSLGLRDGTVLYYQFRRAALATALTVSLKPAVPFQMVHLPRLYTELLSAHNNHTRCVCCEE